MPVKGAKAVRKYIYPAPAPKSPRHGTHHRSKNAKKEVVLSKLCRSAKIEKKGYVMYIICKKIRLKKEGA